MSLEDLAYRDDGRDIFFENLSIRLRHTHPSRETQWEERYNTYENKFFVHILKSALQFKHFMVYSLLSREACMSPSFDDLSSLDHDDVIGTLHSLEPMSDDDDGAPLEEGVECLSDTFLAE